MSQSCTIKNNSGKDLVIAMAIVDGETGSTNAIKSANGRLEILKISDTEKVIKDGSEALITLDRTAKNKTGESISVQDYNLIACDSDWMSPIAVMSVNQENSNYSSQTITPENKKALDQAAAFYQTICLFPSSELTKNYLAALTTAQKKAVSKANGSATSTLEIGEAVTSTVNAFFKSTDDYKDVTLEAFAAIDAFYNNFPCVWSKYSQQAKYYLYTSTGTLTRFAGTLVLEKKAGIDITKENGGYTCTLFPALASQAAGKKEVDQTNGISLNYTAGLFTNDVSASKPTIALRPGFMQKRLFTNKADDNGIIMTMGGQYNGAACVAFEADPTANNLTAAASTSNSFLDYWDNITHPKNKKNLIISILTLLSVILLIPAMSLAAYAVIRAVRLAGRKQESLSEDDVDDDFNPHIYPRRNAFVDLHENNAKLFGDETTVMPHGDLDNIIPAKEFLEIAQHSMALIGAMESYYAGIEELLKYSAVFDNNSKISLQMLLTDLDTSIKNLGNAFNEQDPAFDRILKKECTNYETYSTTFDGVFKRCKARLGTKASSAVLDSIELGERIYKQVTDEMKRDSSEEEELNPEREERFDPIFLDI